MQFTILSESFPYIRPGERYWVCGFRLDQSKHKIILDLPPCLAEACCDRWPEYEQNLRTRGGHASVLVPVKPDGTLDFSDARMINAGLEICKTENDARAAYLHMIQIERYRIQERMASMEDLNTVLSRRLSELDPGHGEAFSVSLVRRGTIRVMAGSKDDAVRTASSANPYDVDWDPGYSCIEAKRLSPAGLDPGMSVKGLELSSRVANALARSGIKTLGQLAALDRSGLKRVRSVGVKSIEEIEKLLARLTLQSEERS